MKKIYSIIITTLFCVNAFAQSGNNCSNAIPVTPTATCTLTSYTTTNSEVWFSFLATSQYMQIRTTAPTFGISSPHLHELILYSGICTGLQVVEDEIFAEINGANEIIIDASGLTVGATYYINASRLTSRGICVPTPAATACGGVSSITFSLCIRSLDVIIPKDFGLEPASISHSYYTNKGQIKDVNNNPNHNIKDYTINSSPVIFHTDTATSFVFAHIDTATTPDTLQRVNMTLAGSNIGIRPFKTEKINSYLNYFLPHAPAGATKIKGYSRTIKTEVYPNIDMQYYSNNMGIKFYFIVKPGGNADNIILKFTGASSINVTPAKGLQIVTSVGTMIFDPGHAYQVNPAGQIVPMPWQADFIQLSPTEVKFDIRNYPANMPLFIQVDRGHLTPKAIQNLDWSTFYSGTGGDDFKDVVTDNSGNVYATGYSGSVDFPTTTGVVQDTRDGGWDAVIVKFDSTGVRQFATYYGGYHNDIGYSIGVDNKKDIFLTGSTKSVDFVTFNPGGGAHVQPLLNGTGVTIPNPFSDAFVVKLNSGGDTLLWATFYGGDNAHEEGYDLTIDGNNNVYVVGGHNTYITTPTIPTFTLTGAYNSTIGTGFILKFNKVGVRLWATRIGGNNGSNPSATALRSCAVDANNNFFVTGKARENGYPVLNAGGSSSYNTSASNTFDAIATKFDANGAIVWSTYYGGGGDENTYGNSAIAVDQAGNAYITGSTRSPNNNPIQLTSAGGWPKFDQPWYGGNEDVFIAEFAPGGARLWGTYFGGSGNEQATNMAFDNNQDLFITGVLGFPSPSYPGGLPLPNPNAANTYIISSPLGGHDGFIATFNSYIYKWGTYFGGNGNEKINSCATYQNNKLYIVGYASASYTFPFDSAGGSPTWYQDTVLYNQNSFITKFDLAPVLIASMDEHNNSDDGITVFPNPSSENITVAMELTGKQNVEITLYNLLGDIVYSETFKNLSGKKQKQVSLSALSSGVYILKIKLDDKIIGKKIIKQY